jgi:hypothetical protein
MIIIGRPRLYPALLRAEAWPVLLRQQPNDHESRCTPEKLRNVLALSDASIKLLRFVSDDVWGSKGVCRVISRSISVYLVQAWDVRNSCKHNGAVLPLSAAPVGRGADGVDAMA